MDIISIKNITTNIVFEKNIKIVQIKKLKQVIKKSKIPILVVPL